MPPLTGPVLAAALLLVTSGALKLVRPAAFQAALAGLGLMRGRRVATVVAAVAEIGVGAAVLTTGSPVACALAAAGYVAFTAVLVVGLRAPERLPTCGCTTATDSPPTVEHAVLTAGLGALCAAAAITGGVTAIAQVAAVTDPLTAVTVLGYAVVVTGLAWAVMVLLPRTR